MKQTQTKRLIEASLMVALATVLSICKVVEMPYGGSVTLASMLPIVILAYRNGIAWGLGGGMVYAVIQQLLGLKNLSYFTTWQSVLAIILLDYVLAFALVGLGGAFRRIIKNQALSLTAGALAVSVIRYICHVISGCTVWAGLSIPDSAALIYSLGYNATYMLPETVILVAVAYYLGQTIDFTRPTPERHIRRDRSGDSAALLGASGISLIVGLVIDVAFIAPCLQDAESGEFSFAGLADVNWIAVAVTTALTLAVGAVFLVLALKSARDGAIDTKK